MKRSQDEERAKEQRIEITWYERKREESAPCVVSDRRGREIEDRGREAERSNGIY